MDRDGTAAVHPLGRRVRRDGDLRQARLRRRRGGRRPAARALLDRGGRAARGRRRQRRAGRAVAPRGGGGARDGGGRLRDAVGAVLLRARADGRLAAGADPLHVSGAGLRRGGRARPRARDAAAHRRARRRLGRRRARAGGRGGPQLGFGVEGLGWIGAIALVSTVGAILTFFAGLARVGPSTAAILSVFEPVVTVALAAVVFGESLALVQLSGGALVLAAVVVVQWPGRAAAARLWDAPAPT